MVCRKKKILRLMFMGDKLKVFSIILIGHSAHCSEGSCPGFLSLDLDLNFFSPIFFYSLIYSIPNFPMHLKFIHSLTSSL